MKRLHRSVLCLAIAGWSAAAFAQTPAKSGVLLLAHGGSAQWNERVADVVKKVDGSLPTEVAFGMASRASIQSAIDKLAARGATEIIAVPLFVSSHSSVITSTEFLLGLRKDAPKDLALFAKMNHASHGAPAASEHAGHAPAADPASPVTTTLPIRMTSALNRHPLIGAIVADRARSISTTPAQEAVILVAHGPVPDDDNQRWLDDMAVLAEQTRASAPYASVDYMTVRDDAGPAMRDAATKELRAKVEAQVAVGRRVLIVPHLMSFGGIEQGVRKRLDGLAYTMTAQALMPDDRIVEWVLASVR
jgi:sirohydrochlorin ferrochelatase